MTKMEPKGGQMKPNGAQMEPQGAQMEPQGGQMEPQGDQMESQGGQIEAKCRQMEPERCPKSPNVTKLSKWYAKGVSLVLVAPDSHHCSPMILLDSFLFYRSLIALARSRYILEFKSRMMFFSPD